MRRTNFKDSKNRHKKNSISVQTEKLKNISGCRADKKSDFES